MADLVVVGSYNTSMTVYSDRLPAPGETVVGSHFDRGPGGKGANQAIGARRLGTDVLFITRLGPTPSATRRAPSCSPRDCRNMASRPMRRARPGSPWSWSMTPGRTRSLSRQAPIFSWLGREPEMVRFPDETHELSRSGSPRHRIMRAQLILDWFRQHLGDEVGAGPAAS